MYHTNPYHRLETTSAYKEDHITIKGQHDSQTGM